jgi:hypothetical protein
LKPPTSKDGSFSSKPWLITVSTRLAGIAVFSGHLLDSPDNEGRQRRLALGGRWFYQRAAGVPAFHGSQESNMT